MIEHRNHRYSSERLPEVGLLAKARPDELFNLMDAQGYIDAHRFPKYGPLDFDMTANQVGITMIEMPEGNYSKGSLFIEDKTMAVSTYQRTGEQHVTFGHEIGHLFAKEKLGDQDNKIDLENFCDYFGYKMLFNKVNFEQLDITDTNQITEIASMAKTDIMAVLKAWIALTDSGNILVTSKLSSDFKVGAGEIRTEPTCKCMLIGGLPCRETDDPLTVDFSEFEVWGSLSSRDHRSPLFENESRRKANTTPTLLGIEIDFDPY